MNSIKSKKYALNKGVIDKIKKECDLKFSTLQKIEAGCPLTDPKTKQNPKPKPKKNKSRKIKTKYTQFEEPKPLKYNKFVSNTDPQILLDRATDFQQQRDTHMYNRVIRPNQNVQIVPRQQSNIIDQFRQPLERPLIQQPLQQQPNNYILSLDGHKYNIPSHVVDNKIITEINRINKKDSSTQYQLNSGTQTDEKIKPHKIPLPPDTEPETRESTQQTEPKPETRESTQQTEPKPETRRKTSQPKLEEGEQLINIDELENIKKYDIEQKEDTQKITIAKLEQQTGEGIFKKLLNIIINKLNNSDFGKYLIKKNNDIDFISNKFIKELNNMFKLNNITTINEKILYTRKTNNMINPITADNFIINELGLKDDEYIKDKGKEKIEDPQPIASTSEEVPQLGKVQGTPGRIPKESTVEIPILIENMLELIKKSNIPLKKHMTNEELENAFMIYLDNEYTTRRIRSNQDKKFKFLEALYKVIQNNVDAFLTEKLFITPEEEEKKKLEILKKKEEEILQKKEEEENKKAEKKNKKKRISSILTLLYDLYEGVITQENIKKAMNHYFNHMFIDDNENTSIFMNNLINKIRNDPEDFEESILIPILENDEFKPIEPNTWKYSDIINYKV